MAPSLSVPVLPRDQFSQVECERLLLWRRDHADERALRLFGERERRRLRFLRWLRVRGHLSEHDPISVRS